jgi:hypothetical protein
MMMIDEEQHLKALRAQAERFKDISDQQKALFLKLKASYHEAQERIVQLNEEIKEKKVSEVKGRSVEEELDKANAHLVFLQRLEAARRKVGAQITYLKYPQTVHEGTELQVIALNFFCPVAYTWYRSVNGKKFKRIAGASRDTYVVKAQDVGAFIRAQVTALNPEMNKDDMNPYGPLIASDQVGPIEPSNKSVKLAQRTILTGKVGIDVQMYNPKGDSFNKWKNVTLVLERGLWKVMDKKKLVHRFECTETLELFPDPRWDRMFAIGNVIFSDENDSNPANSVIESLPTFKYFATTDEGRENLCLVLRSLQGLYNHDLSKANDSQLSLVVSKEFTRFLILSSMRRHSNLIEKLDSKMFSDASGHASKDDSIAWFLDVMQSPFSLNSSSPTTVSQSRVDSGSISVSKSESTVDLGISKVHRISSGGTKYDAEGYIIRDEAGFKWPKDLGSESKTEWSDDEDSVASKFKSKPIVIKDKTELKSNPEVDITEFKKFASTLKDLPGQSLSRTVSHREMKKKGKKERRKSKERSAEANESKTSDTSPIKNVSVSSDTKDLQKSEPAEDTARRSRQLSQAELGSGITGVSALGKPGSTRALVINPTKKIITTDSEEEEPPLQEDDDE